MVTIKDIASKLDISPSTVGRALADDGRISEATKRRVRLEAERLGYVSNRAAQMMRGASSNLVGLIVPDISNSFFSATARSLSQCLMAADYQLALCETDDDPKLEKRHIYELTSANVAAIIIVPTANPRAESVNYLRKTPHIQILRDHPEFGPQFFGIDDRLATYRAAMHLYELGHRRVAYVGGPSDLLTGAGRLAGYRDAARETGNEQLELLGSPASFEFGREAMRELLEMPDRPTGLVLGAILHTEGVLDQLIGSRLKVPQDMSIIGFGDEPGFRWWGPGLTTMRMPIAELATACGLWLVHQLRQPGGFKDGYRSISQPELALRGSTAAPRGVQP
ncbi:LacI family transcriptional regulator [Oceanicola sp. D3]|uniref:LacI family DNA-binding transcriptional regulator n=1 Tax=Oceanicola sp. D3 TaxID=2587163 RepID=UPI00111CD313|nr:LacI family DNA-binding transcriptional regulator [Oceanicola sp. D3]QDC08607.1 LacI family transcriptional regulator [Oceanicola sp. D3]